MAKLYCHFCKAYLGSSTLVLKEAIFFHPKFYSYLLSLLLLLGMAKIPTLIVIFPPKTLQKRKEKGKKKQAIDSIRQYFNCRV